MKFLLVGINAKYIHSNPAIHSLKAYVLQSGEQIPEVELAEFTINHGIEDVLAGIYRAKPDQIGISCYIWNWVYVEQLVSSLAKVLPAVPIWLGGPEATYHPVDILEKHPCVTGVMVGEGEAIFLNLLKHYQHPERYPLKDIPGLVIRQEGRIVKTDSQAPLSLDEIPFLYGKSGMSDFENRIIYYETSRGCPFHCSYCLSSAEESVRLRSMSLVEAELQFFLDRKVPQVKFVDRTFNCNEEHAISIWNYIKTHDNGFTNFHFEMEADMLTPRQLSEMETMRPKLIQVEIGVQSANPNTLKAVHRNPDLTKLERMVDCIHSFGNTHVHLDLIAGLPYEDYESFGQSFDRVYYMKPNQLQLGFLKCLHGTELRRKAEEFQIQFHEHAPYEVLSTAWLSYDDLLRLKQIEEMVELYYNSGQFTTTIPLLERCFARPFLLYEALAAFYEEQGLLLQTPSRLYRYQVLLDFAAIQDPAHVQQYRESLVTDLYLRENLKSRPVFAEDLSSYKTAIQEFYKKEDQERRFLKDYEGYSWRQLMTMTHLEVMENGKAFLLFDYKKRNPLSGNALCYRIPYDFDE